MFVTLVCAERGWRVPLIETKLRHKTFIFLSGTSLLFSDNGPMFKIVLTKKLAKGKPEIGSRLTRHHTCKLLGLGNFNMCLLYLENPILL